MTAPRTFHVAPSALPAAVAPAPRAPAGPPVWYSAARAAVGAALWEVTSADVDSFWLYRLSEFLRQWADEFERRGDALRGGKKIG